MSLVDRSLTLIEDELARASAPAVLWSGGKDSMVLLWLAQRAARAQGRTVPVVYLRPWEHATKHAFVDEVAGQWGLQVITLQPQARDVVGRNGHIEIVEAYQILPELQLYFPLEAEPDYEPDAGAMCAIEKLNEPTSPPAVRFDCLLIGHRGDDVDPVHGPIPLASPVIERGGVRVVYPLRDWTAADVWAVSRRDSIPQDEARYAGDMARNPDYWPLCTRCLEPGDGETVTCPKVGDWVYRLGDLLQPERRAARWRDAFVNLEGRQ